MGISNFIFIWWWLNWMIRNIYLVFGLFYYYYNRILHEETIDIYMIHVTMRYISTFGWLQFIDVIFKWICEINHMFDFYRGFSSLMDWFWKINFWTGSYFWRLFVGWFILWIIGVFTRRSLGFLQVDVRFCWVSVLLETN